LLPCPLILGAAGRVSLGVVLTDSLVANLIIGVETDGATEAVVTSGAAGTENFGAGGVVTINAGS